MSRKHKKVCATLNFIEHFLILFSSINGSISIAAFASLIGMPIGITSPAIGLKICATTPRIKKYELIIKKEKKKHDKIDSVISQDEFALINNLLKEYSKMKEEIKNFKT